MNHINKKEKSLTPEEVEVGGAVRLAGTVLGREKNRLTGKVTYSLLVDEAAPFKVKRVRAGLYEGSVGARRFKIERQDEDDAPDKGEWRLEQFPLDQEYDILPLLGLMIGLQQFQQKGMQRELLKKPSGLRNQLHLSLS